MKLTCASWLEDIEVKLRAHDAEYVLHVCLVITKCLLSLFVFDHVQHSYFIDSIYNHTS